MMSSTFKTISTSVRPARVAVLMNQDDEDWQSTCLRIIEFFSGVWGGAHNIIIPVERHHISPTFWKILEAFDADYFYYYYKTGKDLKHNHPAKYAEWFEREVQSFISSRGSAASDYIREQIDSLLSDRKSTR